MSEKGRYTISELILVMADIRRTFTGTIRRDRDSPTVRGSVKVNEGMIYSMAEDEDELGKNLDEMCVLKLDYDLHSNEGIYIGICGSNFYLN